MGWFCAIRDTVRYCTVSVFRCHALAVVPTGWLIWILRSPDSDFVALAVVVDCFAFPGGFAVHFSSSLLSIKPMVLYRSGTHKFLDFGSREGEAEDECPCRIFGLQPS